MYIFYLMCIIPSSGVREGLAILMDAGTGGALIVISDGQDGALASNVPSILSDVSE